MLARASNTFWRAHSPLLQSGHFERAVNKIDILDDTYHGMVLWNKTKHTWGTLPWSCSISQNNSHVCALNISVSINVVR